MDKTKVLVLLGIVALIVVGCKKEEEQPVVTQVDTSVAVETTATLAVDTVVAVEESLTMPPAPRGSGYAVQVASSTDEAHAVSQIELWKRRGYEPFVSTITHENRTHYRIRMGLFATQAEAKKVVEELTDKYSVKAWIDQMSN